MLASVFPDVTIHEESDKIVIRTSKENFLCNYNYFDSAKVNITIDPKIYKLNYTNSTIKNNNTYTWNLDRNNCSNGEIVLTLNKITEENNIPIDPTEKNKNNNNNILSKYAVFIFCGILIIIVFLGYKWFDKLKNKNNGID